MKQRNKDKIRAFLADEAKIIDTKIESGAPLILTIGEDMLVIEAEIYSPSGSEPLIKLPVIRVKLNGKPLT